MSALTRASLLVAALIAITTSAPAQSLSPLSKEPAAVTGRITVGGKPASGVVVSLLLSDPTIPSSQSPAMKATTDEDGRFRLTGVPPGRYNVLPLAPGFVISTQAELGRTGKSVMLAEGETVEGIDFALTRGGVITGRITDANGRPAVSELVSLMLVDERGQKRPFYPSIPYGLETDDRGIYRIYSLPAGRYLVSAGVERGDLMGAHSFYPRTFHPNVIEEEKATIVEVTAGGEATGVDITLSQPLQTYAASGRIIDAETGQPVANIPYGIGRLDENGRLSSYSSGPAWLTLAEGEFRLNDLAPGRYSVYVRPASDSNSYSDPVTFEVVNADVSGLEVKLRRGASISGAAVIEGPSDPTVLAKLSQLELGVFVQTTEMAVPSNQWIKIGPDGSFRIGGLRSGKVRFGLRGGSRVPQGFSLLRIERDGVEQRDGIEITPSEQVIGVRLVIAYGNAEILGQVKIEGGALPEGIHLRVLARRTDEPPNRYSLNAEVDARGRFEFKGLAAGDYELVIGPMSVYHSGGAPRQQLPTAKQTITVANGAKLPVTLVFDLSDQGKEKER